MATITYSFSEFYDVIALHTAAQIIEGESEITTSGLEALSVVCWNYLCDKNAWPINAINGDFEDLVELHDLRNAAEKFELCAIALRGEVARREEIMASPGN